MANVDAQLVREIADQVMAALGQRASDAVGGDARAQVRAPAGVCTGDYSKFVELQNRGRGQTDETRPCGCGCACGCKGQGGVRAPAGGCMGGCGCPKLLELQNGDREQADDARRCGCACECKGKGQGLNEAKPTRAALGGIVTANQLRTAMDASGDGVAVVAADARLTPLAKDLAREKPGKLRRVTTAAADAGTPGDGGRWLWWSERHFPSSSSMMDRLVGRLVRTGAGRSGAELWQVVRDIAAAVRNGRAAGAVLFVSSAAQAGCFVNRCASLRAVVGTCEDAVAQGMAQVGANVLIVEVPHVLPEVIEAMVGRMTGMRPRVPGHVERALKELERCE